MEGHLMMVPVVIEKRQAACDFCSQGKQECFNSPNSANRGADGRDICRACITSLAKTIGMVMPTPDAPAEQPK